MVRIISSRAIGGGVGLNVALVCIGLCIFLGIELGMYMAHAPQSLSQQRRASEGANSNEDVLIAPEPQPARGPSQQELDAAAKVLSVGDNVEQQPKQPIAKEPQQPPKADPPPKQQPLPEQKQVPAQQQPKAPEQQQPKAPELNSGSEKQQDSKADDPGLLTPYVRPAGLEQYHEENLWKTYPVHHMAPIVDEKHKIVICTIPKAACTIWRKLMRRLNGAKDWNTNKEEITHNYGWYSSGLTYLDMLPQDKIRRIMHDDSYIKVAIVRNPLTRLLSAWKDKFGPGSVHNWGRIPWPDFINKRTGPRCRGDEHWIPQSCYCGMRQWDYDYVVHMENDEMKRLADHMVATGHLPSSVVDSGWGKDGNERFLQSNSVFHRTGADTKVVEYYSNSKYPGILDKVLQDQREDIIRFGYQEVAEMYKEAAKNS